MPPASGDARYALIVAVSAYSDSGLTDLVAPGRDAENLAAVLRHRDIGHFREVEVLLDPDHSTAQHRIERFFDRRDPLDIAVLHFSGHAFRGEDNDDLFLAMRDTRRDSPVATSVPGGFLRSVIEKSRAKRKLLLLDCCHSGALTLTRDLRRPGPTPDERTRAAEVFKAGVQRIAPEPSQPQSNATGTVIIGAARATELARETHTGALTGAVVEGLATGDADRNRTGKISTENLFEYVTEWFQKRDLHQHPVVQQRSRSGQFIVAENCAFQPIALPDGLENLLLDPDPAQRVRAVHQLRPLALAADHDIAETAFRRLRHLAQFDFDDQVTAAAHQALHRMVPTAVPRHLDFGNVRLGAPVPPRVVRILAPPPAHGWTARTPEDAAVTVSRHDDRLEVALHTARPGRLDTTIPVDSVAGTAEVRITARVHRPPSATRLAGWYRDRRARPAAGARRRAGAGMPRVAGRVRRLLIAAPVAVLLALPLTSFHVLPSAKVLGPCMPRDDLRVLTADALRDAVEAAAAGFAGGSPGDACPDIRVTVSSVTSDGVAQQQFAEQWPDADLRVAGPSPDVWLPESSVRVGLARAAIPADAPHRLELPADPAAASVASSPLVLAATDTVAPAGPLRPE
ncbi:MAG TPA: caspase family protein, partial [Actinoplanes sp.]|nr:caspase family protein [Actinoplanes sp.]